MVESAIVSSKVLAAVGLNNDSEALVEKVKRVLAEATEPSEAVDTDRSSSDPIDQLTDEFSALKVETDSVASSVSSVVTPSMETSSKNSQPSICDLHGGVWRRRRGMKLSPSDSVSNDLYVKLDLELEAVDTERATRLGMVSKEEMQEPVLAASEPDEMDRAVKLGMVSEDEVEEPMLDSSCVGSGVGADVGVSVGLGKGSTVGS